MKSSKKELKLFNNDQSPIFGFIIAEICLLSRIVVLIILNLLKRKSDLQQSLAHSNPLLPTSDTLPKNGKTTVLKKDYWVSRLPAY